jgi:hypothetical protein
VTTDPASNDWPPGWKTTRDAAAGHPPPTVGRIVVWVDTQRRSWPGIVLSAVGTTVDLTVFSPMPAYYSNVAQDSGDGTPGTWHWPARV